MRTVLFGALLFLLGCSTVPRGVVIEKARFSSADESLVGDLYLPPSKEKTPVVVVVHGGGWTSRTGDMTAICKKLAKNGIAAFNITYRLAPKHTYPKQLFDVEAAIDWLKQNADQYNIDAQRVGGWGYSAGANLIMLAGLKPETGLKAVVSGGTPAQLTYWPKSEMITTFIGRPMETHKSVWQKASPINNIEKDSPPVFLYHGDWDTLVTDKQMDLMSAELERNQVEVETYRAGFLGHFAVYFLSFEAETRGVNFLKERL